VNLLLDLEEFDPQIFQVDIIVWHIACEKKGTRKGKGT